MPKLTKRTVDAAKASTKEQFIWDSQLPGFGLRVKTSGAKSFLIQYRNASRKTRRFTIGKANIVPAERARKFAARLLADVADGADPSAERKETRQAETVEQLAGLYLRDYAGEHKAQSSARTDAGNLRNHVLFLIGKMKVRDLKRADIERMHRDIKNGKTARKLPARPRGRSEVTGGPGIANRCLRLVSKMLACAEQWGIREGNPARGISLYPEKPMKRYLDAEEISRLVAALNAAERDGTETPQVIAAFRVLLFTGLRRGEVLDLRWKDIDLRSHMVRLQHTKAGEGRDAPLNASAQKVIASLPEGKPNDLVFHGATGSSSKFSPGKPWTRIRKAANLGSIEINGITETARLHTLRHTVGTHGAASGMSEFDLMHLLGHKHAATTRRYVSEVQDATRRNAEIIGNTIAAMGAGDQSAEVIELKGRKASS